MSEEEITGKEEETEEGELNTLVKSDRQSSEGARSLSTMEEERTEVENLKMKIEASRRSHLQ
jgi:hypothetical protein